MDFQRIFSFSIDFLFSNLYFYFILIFQAANPSEDKKYGWRFSGAKRWSRKFQYFMEINKITDFLENLKIIFLTIYK